MEALDALGINFGYLLANIINLTVMIALLGAIAYKPITKLLKERRDRIAEGVNNARRAEEALAGAEEQKQSILDEARAEAQKLITDARARAQGVEDQIKAEAQEEAKRILEQARNDAEAERGLALANMREQIVSLSMAAANRLVDTGLDDNKQKGVVEEFFTALPAEAKGLGDEVTVITAVPLTDKEKSKYSDQLGASSIAYQVDPGILGGVVVRSGGQEVDSSFRSQLAALRSQLN